MKRKFKIPVKIEDDMSYYLGLSHAKYEEVELEEYVWSIHERIDSALTTIRLNDNIINAIGIPKSYLTGFKGQQYISPGYVYAPYITMYNTPVINNTRKDIYGIYDRYKNKIINSKIFLNYKNGRYYK